MRAALPSQRPPAFTYRSPAGLFSKSRAELQGDRVSLSRLAKQYGTPLYVYSASAIRERYAQFDRAFAAQQHTVCYSVKANSNLSILRLLASLGSGFDIVSGGELQRVLKADRKAARNIVFSGVGKRADEIDAALQTGILLFNVESAGELELLSARTTHLRKTAHFAIRVNPDVAAETHPYISTGLHQHKFGVPWREAPQLYRSVAGNRRLKAAGVSVHIGSQIAELGPFHQAMQRVAELIISLRAEGHDIRYADAGGGLGIFYRDSQSTAFSDLATAYARAVVAPLKGLEAHVLLEPGRAIVAPAGILLTRVLYRKSNNGKKFLVVDAAMNDLLRPTLYEAYHEIVPVVVPKRPAAIERTDIVGPICETGDFLARDREMIPVNQGELLAVCDAGAYGMSLASNYNSRPRPAEVLVEGNSWRLIRKRESIADMLSTERT